MNVAILCNNTSDIPSARKELIIALHQKFEMVFSGGVLVDRIDPYFCEETAQFMPIIASRNNTNPINEIKSIISVRNQVKKNSIQSVIIYGVKNHAAMSIGAWLGGAKYIVCVVNGSGNLFLLQGIKGKILRLIAFPMLRVGYKCSSSVCFQNSDDRDLFLRKKLINRNKDIFITGGSGVNLLSFPKQPLPNECRFLFLARITPTKGIREYIDAARIVKEKYPDAVYDIVGPLDSQVESGAVREYLSQAVEDGVVDYHGKTNDVAGWLGKCRFFVYPSYYPEGVPRCAIQAVSTGRPVITCDTPGCRETVENGVNGFLVAPKSADELANAMIWMIENPATIEQMGINSRKIAEKNFDVNKINCDILDRLGSKQ